MDLDEIKALIALMAESGLAEMSFSENGWSLRLVRDAGPPPASSARPAATPTAAPSAAPPAVQPADHAVLVAPLAGILHLQSAPGAPPYVREGQAVRMGDTLCVIEAMKVFNTINAAQDGVVAAVLVASGSEVDGGQPLMRFA